LYKDITGIILSGGKSSRMGSDKALLKIGSETIIERITNLIKSIFSDVFIVSNTPGDYKFLNIPLYEDIYKSKGPLSGIHSGLVHSSTDKNFFISCDLPLVSEELIRFVVDYKSDKPARFCFAGGRHHYLSGIYAKALLPEIERIIRVEQNYQGEKGKTFSMKNLFMNVEVKVINVETLPFYDENLFFNLNTPEDFEHLKKILSTQ
jgi:molybdenum cofactor guanylyltransferase